MGVSEANLLKCYPTLRAEDPTSAWGLRSLTSGRERDSIGMARYTLTRGFRFQSLPNCAAWVTICRPFRKQARQDSRSGMKLFWVCSF